MSAMSMLDIQIEELYLNGNTPSEISEMLDIPTSIVYDWLVSNRIIPFDQWSKDAQDRLIATIRG